MMQDNVKQGTAHTAKALIDGSLGQRDWECAGCWLLVVYGGVCVAIPQDRAKK